MSVFQKLGIPDDDAVDQDVGAPLDLDEVDLRVVLRADGLAVRVDDPAAQDLGVADVVDADHAVDAALDVDAAGAGVEVTGGARPVKEGAAGQVQRHVALQPELADLVPPRREVEDVLGGAGRGVDRGLHLRRHQGGAGVVDGVVGDVLDVRVAETRRIHFLGVEEDEEQLLGVHLQDQVVRSAAEGDGVAAPGGGEAPALGTERERGEALVHRHGERGGAGAGQGAVRVVDLHLR